MESELGEIRRIIVSDKTIEKAIETSVLRDPEKLANIIYPVIGPAILVSIKEFLEQMIYAFNRAVENTFSKQGLIWRWESIVSGQPYSEVVLLHSLLYKVEDIFVIHKKTGILLLHTSLRKSNQNSADYIAGMLTAIHDFVGEAFSKEHSAGQSLTSVQVGDMNLMMEEEEGLIVAAAVKGNPTSDFRHKLHDKLSSFQLNFSNKIAEFKGDTEDFAGSEDYFKDCLVQELKPPSYDQAAKRKNKIKTRIAGSLVLVMFLASLGWLGRRMILESRNEQLIEKYVDSLKKQPGIVFLGYEKTSDESWIVRTLEINQWKTELPALPGKLKNKVKVISTSILNPLQDLKIPYRRDTKVINGDPAEYIEFSGRIIKALLNTKKGTDFFIHAYVFDNPDDLRTRVLLSRIIGKLEDSLSRIGVTDNKIIKYSIVDDTGLDRPPNINFEVIYD